MRYTAVCRRAGDWWAISVPEIKGVHTQARRLDQVEAMVRDAIALFFDVKPDSFDIEIKPEVPTEATEATAARKAAREAETWADKLTRAAAAALLAKGYTVRDAGALLEISPQRVSQLTADSSMRTAAKGSEAGPAASTQAKIGRTTRNSARSGRGVVKKAGAKQATTPRKTVTA